MKTVHIIIVLLVSGLLFASGITGFFVLRKSENSQEYLVKKVLDGDTIELSDNQKVRLLGINAPETKESHYQDSRNRLVELVENKSVRFEYGPEDKDLYDRLLRYVFVKSTFVNLQLVKEGYATVYLLDADEKYYLEFKTAEKNAKENKLVIWGVSENERCLVLVTLHYDASGNDNENLNDEHATFKNNCDYPISMKGWEIKDSGTNIYNFKNFAIDGSSSFTIFSGKGADTKSKLYWSSTRAIWNNNGDTLYLRDNNGGLVLSYSYP